MCTLYSPSLNKFREDISIKVARQKLVYLFIFDNNYVETYQYLQGVIHKPRRFGREDPDRTRMTRTAVFPHFHLSPETFIEVSKQIKMSLHTNYIPNITIPRSKLSTQPTSYYFIHPKLVRFL